LLTHNPKTAEYKAAEPKPGSHGRGKTRRETKDELTSTYLLTAKHALEHLLDVLGCVIGSRRPVHGAPLIDQERHRELAHAKAPCHDTRSIVHHGKLKLIPRDELLRV
jgi:hypothetical protein